MTVAQPDPGVTLPQQQDPSAPPSEFKKAVEQKLAQVFYRSARFSLPITILNALLASYIVFGVTHYHIAFWTVAVVGLTAVRLGLAQHIILAEKFTDPRIDRIYLALTAACGILWGLLPLSLTHGVAERPLEVVGAVAVLLGTSAGVALSSATKLRAVDLFNVPAMALLAVFFLQDITDKSLIMAAMAGFFYVTTRKISAEICHSIVESKVNEEKLRLAQAALQERTDALKLVAEEAEAANAAKTHFLSMMSHELRTPLNSILGFSEMIHEQIIGKIDNPKYVDYAGNVRHSANHLLSVVSDILDVSMIESGRLELHETRYDVVQSIHRLVEGMAPIFATKSIQSRLSAPDEGVMIRADETRLNQAFTNILSNSVKFLDDGGTIAVEISTAPDGRLRLTLRDDGPGIAEEDRAVIFDAFGQGHVKARGGKAGVGLGLFITKKVVEAHQGTIALDPDSRDGASMTIILPSERIG